jgi:hypothetical protein
MRNNAMPDLTDALAALESLVQQREALAREHLATIAHLLTPHQRDALASLEQEYASAATVLRAQLLEAKEAIQHEVLTLGTSVKGMFWQAVHTDGKPVWDSSKLETLARRYPAIAEELMQCRDYGKASVRIVACARGRSLLGDTPASLLEVPHD